MKAWVLPSGSGQLTQIVCRSLKWKMCIETKNIEFFTASGFMLNKKKKKKRDRKVDSNFHELLVSIRT